MSCVLSPGHGAHCAIRLLLFHAYYVVTIKPKSYCLLLLKKRCKVVVARATYFISLKDVSFASENQRSKHCGHSRDRTCDPFLRGEMLYSTELCVLVGTGNATYQSRFGRCRQTKDFKPTLTGNILTLTFNNLQTNHYLLLFHTF